MSNNDPNLNPTNYVNKLFGQAAEEIGIDPQQLVGLLLFQFLKVTPEDRGVKVAFLKKDFNKFAEKADFEAVAVSINNLIDKEELALLDWLSDVWDNGCLTG